ncbi:hypothetical protein HDU67_009485 [Dinochytrium kinnereticum]|nr:hypothetical protein HDU67_009485 [Dinochytrium kinnereticum]
MKVASLAILAGVACIGGIDCRSPHHTPSLHLSITTLLSLTPTLQALRHTHTDPTRIRDIERAKHEVNRVHIQHGDPETDDPEDVYEVVFVNEEHPPELEDEYEVVVEVEHVDHDEGGAHIVFVDGEGEGHDEGEHHEEDHEEGHYQGEHHEDEHHDEGHYAGEHHDEGHDEGEHHVEGHHEEHANPWENHEEQSHDEHHNEHDGEDSGDHWEEHDGGWYGEEHTGDYHDGHKDPEDGTHDENQDHEHTNDHPSEQDWDDQEHHHETEIDPSHKEDISVSFHFYNTDNANDDQPIATPHQTRHHLIPPKLNATFTSPHPSSMYGQNNTHDVTSEIDEEPSFRVRVDHEDDEPPPPQRHVVRQTHTFMSSVTQAPVLNGGNVRVSTVTVRTTIKVEEGGAVPTGARVLESLGVLRGVEMDGGSRGEFQFLSFVVSVMERMLKRGICFAMIEGGNGKMDRKPHSVKNDSSPIAMIIAGIALALTMAI